MNRYCDEALFGAERAQFTETIGDAYKNKQIIPTLAEFRIQLPQLVSTSSHTISYNVRVNFLDAHIILPPDNQSTAPLTDDLL